MGASLTISQSGLTAASAASQFAAACPAIGIWRPHAVKRSVAALPEAVHLQRWRAPNERIRRRNRAPREAARVRAARSAGSASRHRVHPRSHLRAAGKWFSRGSCKDAAQLPERQAEALPPRRCGDSGRTQRGRSFRRRVAVKSVSFDSVCDGTPGLAESVRRVDSADDECVRHRDGKPETREQHG